MTRFAFRMAFVSSWGGARSDRLRALVLTSAAGLVAFVLCTLVSIGASLGRVAERDADRAFLPASPGERPALEHHVIFDVAPSDYRQIYVYWWRLNDRDVRLPGVEGHPPHGSWLVSPALARRMEDDDRLRERFPDAGLIGEAGITNADELLAYRFVGPGAHLESALRDEAGAGGYYLGDELDTEARSLVRSSLVLFAIPLVGLLLAGMAPAAVGLDRRLGVLEALGAPTWARRAVVSLQATMSALPGAVVATVAWFIVAPHLTAVPVVGREVFAGDLALPAPLAATAVTTVLAATALAAVVRTRNSPSLRPGEAVPRRPSRARMDTLFDGAGLMLYGSGVVG